MTPILDPAAARRGFPFRLLGWGGVAFLLLLPLVAGAPWTLSDYVFAGVILGGAGVMLELAVRSSGTIAQAGGAAAAILGVVLLIWVNGAVGFLGNEDNPANLVFVGVIAIPMIGAIVAGFRPAGMARAMAVTAAVQLAIGIVAPILQLGAPGMHGIHEAALGTSLFLTIWLSSHALFRKAAADRARTEA